MPLTPPHPHCTLCSFEQLATAAILLLFALCLAMPFTPRAKRLLTSLLKRHTTKQQASTTDAIAPEGATPEGATPEAATPEGSLEAPPSEPAADDASTTDSSTIAPIASFDYPFGFAIPFGKPFQPFGSRSLGSSSPAARALAAKISAGRGVAGKGNAGKGLGASSFSKGLGASSFSKGLGASSFGRRVAGWRIRKRRTAADLIGERRHSFSRVQDRVARAHEFRSIFYAAVEERNASPCVSPPPPPLLDAGESFRQRVLQRAAAVQQRPLPAVGSVFVADGAARLVAASLSPAVSTPLHASHLLLQVSHPALSPPIKLRETPKRRRPQRARSPHAQERHAESLHAEGRHSTGRRSAHKPTERGGHTHGERGGHKSRPPKLYSRGTLPSHLGGSEASPSSPAADTYSHRGEVGICDEQHLQPRGRAYGRTRGGRTAQGQAQGRAAQAGPHGQRPSAEESEAPARQAQHRGRHCSSASASPASRNQSVASHSVADGGSATEGGSEGQGARAARRRRHHHHASRIYPAEAEAAVADNRTPHTLPRRFDEAVLGTAMGLATAVAVCEEQQTQADLEADYARAHRTARDGVDVGSRMHANTRAAAMLSDLEA